MRLEPLADSLSALQQRLGDGGAGGGGKMKKKKKRSRQVGAREGAKTNGSVPIMRLA
jgi:hypothetical protein